MVQLFVVLIFLLFIGLLVVFSLRARRPAPPMPQPEPLPASQLMAHLQVIATTLPCSRRHRLPRCLPIRQLNSLLRQKSTLPALAFLRDSGRELLMVLLSLRQRLRRAPAALPRLMGLCQRYWLLGGAADADALLAALGRIQPAAGLTLRERLHFPLCLAVALCRQLEAVLVHLRLSLAEYRRGQRLAHRLRRARKPMQLLARHPLTTTETHALLTRLSALQEDSLLASIHERLSQQHTSAQQVTEAFTSRQTLLADHLRRLLACLRTLEALDWPALLEPQDPLHRLLEEDPTGTYPAMDAPSRALYRQHAAQLARLFHVEEQHLVQQTLALCRQADPDGLRDHVGWYLLENDGIRALRKRLHTRHGLLRLFVKQAEPWLCRAGLSAAALAGGLCFLHARHPLWALPVFLGVWSCLTHALADVLRRLHPPAPLPRMSITRLEENARVLLVLPAVLRNGTQAVQAVRRLLLARKAFTHGPVDCLLLADYEDCITQVSSGDEGIVTAARMAASAVDGDGGRFLYLQRRRSWDAGQHAYTGRQRRRGALESLNQLIVQGECDDAFDAASLPPSAFHRRYAYVLALDARSIPTPDSLLPLLGALTHPLNQRRHTVQGLRGCSMLLPGAAVDAAGIRSPIGLWAQPEPGCCLYRPDALWESTEGWLTPGASLCHHWLEGALSGCATDHATLFFTQPPATLDGWLSRLHRHTRGDWQLLPWLLTHVQTPDGLRRNPLSSASKYQLRQRLRRSLVPLCRLLLFLYGVLCRSLPMTLLALLAPVQTPARLVELPLQAAVQGDAILRALWRSFVTHRGLLDRQPAFASAGLSVWENWSQCLSAIALGAAALALQPVFLPGLALALAFGCFPLVHPWLDAPLSSPMPAGSMELPLLEIAQATWLFFAETVTGATHHLPPGSLQQKPWRGTAKTTTPGDMGLYLLSCLAAEELGLMDAKALCSRVSSTMDTLCHLPLWHGLPYQAYALDTLAPVQPAFVPSQDCGLLCACLITLAQGLRSLLPQMPETFAGLPAQVDAFAAGMELSRLYDSQAQLFSTGFDAAKGTLSPQHHSLYASQALLLSFVAVMRREVPPAHLSRLNRTLVRLGRDTPYVSPHGTASDYLLPVLLLPAAPHTMMARTLRAVIRAQRKHGAEGMFGLSESGCWAFDPQLNYQRRTFGLKELALGPCSTRRVIAPYAAALCLPFAPQAAFESLMHLRSRGMLTRYGYCESLDMDPAHLPQGTEEAPVQAYAAGHQGMLLCALCNALTGNALVKHFTAVPAAAAAAPLLQQRRRPSVVLPARLTHPEGLAPREAPFRRSAAPLCAPVDAHLIGSPEAMLLMSAQGLGCMRSRGVPLTRFTGDPTRVEGVQFYLRAGTQVFRLTDPALPGDTLFAEGEMRFIRTCGPVQATLTALTDPVQGAFLHMIELENLSGREHHVDIASCLVPDLQASSLVTARPEERVLTATRQTPGQPAMTLCHALTTHAPLLGLAAETDRTAFQGRNRTLHHPAAMDAPLADGSLGVFAAPCLSFRARLRLGAKGRAAAVFVTRLMGQGEAFSLETLAPRLSDVGSLLALSRLLGRTMTDALGLSQSKAAELSRLFGTLLWGDQPRQGAIGPLELSAACLDRLGLDPALPILAVMAHSAGCGTLVQDAGNAAEWLALMGQEITLCVLCQGSQAAQARDRAQAILRNRRGAVLLCAQLEPGVREAIEAASRFILYEDAGTVAEQVEAQAQAVPASHACSNPEAPSLPAEALRFSTGCAGLQPETGDWVLRLEQGAAAPAPWRCLLAEEQASCLCLESGLGAAFAGCSLTQAEDDPVCTMPAECVYLSGDMGIFTPTPLPLGQGLSTRVQLSPGAGCWHSLGHGLDMTLTASILPETAFACRCLRLKNMTQAEICLTLTIAARFAMGDAAFASLAPMDGCVAVTAPGVKVQGCLALVEGDCQARCVSPLAFHGFGQVPDLNAPEDEAGTLALLSLPLRLPAGGSQAISWLLGACRQMDELELLLARLRETGTSVIFREARRLWADRLNQLTIRTPEEDIDLMMNLLLPWQVLTLPPSGSTMDAGHLLQCIPALLHTQPAQARALLLACARHQYTEGDMQRWWHHEQTGLRTRSGDPRLLLPLMTGWYVRRTGDAAVLDALVPWLLGEEVPAGQESLCHTPPSTSQQDSLRTHCLRALTSLPLGTHGLPLTPQGESIARGLVLALAVHLFAPCVPEASSSLEDTRTQALQAIEQLGWAGSWYAGTLFQEDTPISIPCQGLAAEVLGCTERTAEALGHALQQASAPEDAAPLLPALCSMGWCQQAWALVQALNPVRRSPGGMQTHQAARLYTTVLERLLGFERRGNQVRLRPMVPPEWDSFTLTLQWGASTWHFHAGQDEPLLTCDGEQVTCGWVTLADDGRIHQVRTPLRRGS